MKYKPTMYYKNVFDIPYSKLKDEGYSCLVFDLDNTLALIKEAEFNLKTKNLLLSLKKDFIVYIVTNNHQKRLSPFLKQLGIKGVYHAAKPFTRGLKKICKSENIQKNQMIMIGDQLVTDIRSGNRFGIATIYVDALSAIDLKVTKFNRLLENRILNKYEKLEIMKRGNYYGF